MREWTEHPAWCHMVCTWCIGGSTLTVLQREVETENEKPSGRRAGDQQGGQGGGLEGGRGQSVREGGRESEGSGIGAKIFEELVIFIP